jgi:uncharacterized protein
MPGPPFSIACSPSIATSWPRRVTANAVISTAPASPTVVVSIHDVTPAHEDAVRALWTRCREHGLTPALLVVPNWHGRWRLAEYPRFVQWLHRCAEAGADVLLHGERHDEHGLRRRWRDEWRAVGRTAAEGEFLTLDAWQARERIERGLLYLWSLDLRPIGFVPPAWLAHASTHEVVRNTGLAVSEDAASIYLHDASGDSIAMRAPAVRWSGRSSWRAHVSRAVVDWHWRSARHQRAVRLALHPQDLLHHITKRSVWDHVARWASVGQPTHYRDLAPV